MSTCRTTNRRENASCSSAAYHREGALPRFELDQQVYIAVRSRLATGGRAEQREPRHDEALSQYRLGRFPRL